MERVDCRFGGGGGEVVFTFLAWLVGLGWLVTYIYIYWLFRKYLSIYRCYGVIFSTTGQSARCRVRCGPGLAVLEMPDAHLSMLATADRSRE